MQKAFYAFIVLLLGSTGVGLANSHQFMLTAGDANINIDYATKRDLKAGYLKTGLGGMFRKNDNKEYQIGHGTLSVGSKTWLKGIGCDLGFRGLFGRLEKDRNDANAGALGFHMGAVYTLPEQIAPIHIDLVAGLTWAPDVLCFADLDTYSEFKAGVHIYIVENAALVLAYQHNAFDTDDNWEWDSNSLSAGIFLNF
jgi:hypothetical protein